MKNDVTGYISSASIILINKIAPMESITTFFSILAPIVIMVYHLAMLRKNVVKEDHNGSWRKFLLSWFNLKKKNDEN